MSEKFLSHTINQPARDAEIVSTIESKIMIEHRIANAFLFNRYPLSEEGKAFRQLVKEALEAYEKGNKKPLEKIKDRLPTVERPHLELFEDFHITTDQELMVFGPQLSCVQTTKGCRHQCEHCAADAKKKVECMPFVAVLKIAEKFKGVQNRRKKAFNDWKALVINYLQNGPKKKSWEKIRDNHIASTKYTKADDYEVLREIIRTSNEQNAQGNAEQIAADQDVAFEIYDEIRKIFASVLSTLNTAGILSIFFDRNYPWQSAKALKFDSQYIFSKNGFPGHLTHYFDSDPFDYRDTTFLHEDGTPADYGDIFLAHAPITEKIEITTAGWPKNDAIAQRAAEKIVQFVRLSNLKRVNPFRESEDATQDPAPRGDFIRISIHPFERGTSRGDMMKYREDMENVLRTLDQIDPVIIFIKSGDQRLHEKFVRDVIVPLEDSTQNLKHISTRFNALKTEIKNWNPVSHFSGRAKNNETDTKNHDVMACTEGIHIWPNGTVLEQCRPLPIVTTDSMSSGFVEQGMRPKPFGFKLYSIVKK